MGVCSHSSTPDYRTNSIEPDLVCSILHSHGLGSAGGCGFRSVVPGKTRSGSDTSSGGYLDEDTAFATLLHVRNDDSGG